MANRFQRNKIFIGFSTVIQTVPSTRLYDIDLVKRDLQNHFMTRLGERVMKPTFGSIIWDLLFEPFTETVRQQVISDVRRVINSDPRVELVDLQVNNEEYGITVEAILQYNPFAVLDTLYVRYVRENFATDSENTTRFSEDNNN